MAVNYIADLIDAPAPPTRPAGGAFRPRRSPRRPPPTKAALRSSEAPDLAAFEVDDVFAIPANGALMSRRRTEIALQYIAQ